MQFLDKLLERFHYGSLHIEALDENMSHAIECSSPRRGSHKSAWGRATIGSAAPGSYVPDGPSPERAKQGGAWFCAALSGLVKQDDSIPRALPWAGL